MKNMAKIINKITGNLVFPSGLAYEIYSNERLILKPNKVTHVHLPYIRDFCDDSILFFELGEKLASQGIMVLNHNLNDESACDGFNFIVYNLNSEGELKRSYLEQLVGSSHNVDIIPMSFFGNLFQK